MNNQRRRKNPTIPPFSERIPLVAPFNERAFYRYLDSNGTLNNREAQKLFNQIRQGSQFYGRLGKYDETGAMIATEHVENHVHLLSDYQNPNFMREESGFIGRDQTPGFFNRRQWRNLGTKTLVPDETYLLWMNSMSMSDVVEEMDEWDYTFEFKAMDEVEQVEFGSPAETSDIMRNREYGSGLALKYTWLETNKFGIKTNALVPKAKFTYFQKIANEVYSTMRGLSHLTLPSPTNHLIKDLNDAHVLLGRQQNWNNQSIYEGASCAILAPPEMAPYLEQASRLAGNSLNTMNLIYRLPIIYSWLLPAAESNIIYVVRLKHEKNAIGTRVPFTVLGPQEDIQKFGRIMTFRGAYGTKMDATSFVKLTLDLDELVVAGPYSTKEVAP